jgi:predicted nucleic-acid-binding protein
MIGVDANVLLRLILDDDAEQSPIVERIYRRAGVGGIYVSLVVIVEIAWVLKRLYREKPSTILDMIADLLEAREYLVERPELVRTAIADARKAGCGLADAIIALLASEAGVEKTLTFDTRAKRLPTMRDAATYR